MANYPIQSASHGGLPALTMVTPVNGDTVQPTPSGFLIVECGASGAPVLTLTPPTYDGQAVGPRAITMAANNTYLIPIPTSVYGTGLLTLAWSGTLTTVTVAAAVVTST